MSNRHIEKLTDRLLQALDSNYDVINMDAVLSVIAALEKTTITKEQLEATRLAKYINLFRRRTKSDQLAKRAKSLLKKWREMVGMQQQPYGPTSGGYTELQFEGPTSPISGGGSSSVPPMRTGNITAIYQNNLSNVANVIDKPSQQKWTTHGNDPNQPISFANLINFSGTGAMGPTCTPSSFSSTNGPNQNVRVGRKNRASKHAIDTTTSEVFSMEPTINSSSAVNTDVSSAPIIIDIDDSNSGSNLIEKPDDVVIICETPAGGASMNSSKSNKHKKNKREKKKARDNRGDTRDAPTPLVVIDAESSQSQQQPVHMATINTMPDKSDNKIRNCSMMIENMSEILSLSNSSMSCVFPTSSVGESKNMYASHKSSARPLTEADLSFAGKFGGASTTTTTCDPSSSSTKTAEAFTAPLFVGDMYIENSNNAGGGHINVETTLKATDKLQLFTGSGYNSNDSVSNSRHSNFEIVDSVSQGIGPVPTLADNATLDFNAAPAIPMQKVPKKRGRKKGSKGVDSLIAKDTSLSSQMLMQSLSSGSKKVKTTKELYAEMQNRKLGVSTSTSPPSLSGVNCNQQQQQQQQQQSLQQQTHSRRNSFCSEPSLHSPRTFDACSTNATVSTIATSSTTPDKNGSTLQRSKRLKRILVDIESESDSLISGGLSRESIAQECSLRPVTSIVLNAVEQQLRELILKLPPVPSISQIENDCTSEIVPCSCKIIEILPEQTTAAAAATATAETTSTTSTIKKEAEQSAPVIRDLLSLDGDETELPVITIIVAGNGDNDNIDKSKDKKSIAPIVPIAPIAKPQKSIFDLDFDDDEDPLHTLIAEVAAANSASVNAVTTKTEDDTFEESKKRNDTKNDDEILPLPNDTTSINAVPMISPTSLNVQQQLLPLLPSYEVEEDVNCLAKERFEIQTQQVTEFHINLLHNFFIPNVNGNWNDTVDKEKIVRSTDSEIAILDGSNVVPLISVEESIKKNLLEINFTCHKNTPQTETLNIHKKHNKEAPFLGVARCLPQMRKRTRKCRQNAEKINISSNESNNVTTTTNDDTVAAVDVNIKSCVDSVESVVNMEGVEGIENIDDIEKSSIKVEEPIMENLSCGLKNPNAHLEAISIRVDHDNDIDIDVDGGGGGVGGLGLGVGLTQNSMRNATSGLVVESQKTQNLLAIASNVLGGVQADMSAYKSDHDHNPNVDVPLGTEIDATINFPRIGGDIIHNNNNNNNNNNCSNKFGNDVSSCESNTSLKQTQNSINQKLRKQRRRKRRQLLEQEQNSPKLSTKRKRRRKKRTSPIKIKCLKIAINGGITTQRHIQIATSNSNSSAGENDHENDSEDDDEDEDDDMEAEENEDYNEDDDEDEDEDANDNDNDNDKKIGGEEVWKNDTETESENSSQTFDDEFDEWNKGMSMSNNSKKELLKDKSPITVKVKVKGFENDKMGPIHDNNENDNENENDCKRTNERAGDDGDDEEEEDDGYADENENENENENGENGEEDDEDEDDYFSEFHEVVTRDLSPSSAFGNNHIVLTFKKTPSKTNSPVSNSPNIITQTAIKENDNDNDIDNDNVSVNVNVNVDVNIDTNVNVTNIENANDNIKESELDATELINNQVSKSELKTMPSNWLTTNYATVIKRLGMRRRLKRRRRRISKPPLPFRFPDEMNRTENGLVFKKKHQQLFFPHELYMGGNDDGVKRQRILNMSSCSSSCDESSNYEYESQTSDDVDDDVDEDKKIKSEMKSSEIMKSEPKDKKFSTYWSGDDTKTTDSDTTDTDTDTDTNSDSDTNTDTDTEPKENTKRPRMSDCVNVTKMECSTNDDDVQNMKNEEKLPEENNGQLFSFNNICLTANNDDDNIPAIKDAVVTDQCVDAEKPMSKFKPRPEYVTGMRDVQESVGESASKDNLQQFKEWHQVLQLKSYNNELLTVLPYVVLD